MAELWICPKCHRAFRQVNQRHACGTGDKSNLLRGRSEELVQLYRVLEHAVRECDGVEIVYRDRYVLFRTSRIFADLVMMKDALRLAVHLKRAVQEPLFFKEVKGERGQISYVAKIRCREEWQRVKPYLMEAYRISIEER
ncbi:MAG: DUF5655 domain-containing protein [bacterium]